MIFNMILRWKLCFGLPSLRCVDAEAMLAVGSGQDDGVLGVLLDMAGVDHLVEDLSRGLALGCLFLEHAHSSF